MIFFIFFIHGLTSNAVLSNVNIEFKGRLIELNVHDTIKNTELLRHIIEKHLLETKIEDYSKLFSIRKPEEHARKKKEYSEKRKERLSEIESRLRIIKKNRDKNTSNLRKNGENLVINKNLIRKAERYLNESIWLFVFSLSVIFLGSLMAKIGFKR